MTALSLHDRKARVIYSGNLIKVALVALAAVAAYYVYAFSVLVMPWTIAVCAAASLVSTYIGLAFLEVPEDQKPRAIRVATAAMIVESAYGVLYVLSVQSPELFVAPLDWRLSCLLAVLHGGAFSVLAFSVSLLVVHSDSQASVRDALTQERDALRSLLTQSNEERDAAVGEASQFLAVVRTVEGERDALLTQVGTANERVRQLERQPPALADADTVTIGGRSYSTRKAASALGINEATLRRQLKTIEEV